MKHILFSFLLVVFTATSFAQQIEPAPYNPNTDYLKKSKQQKTAGWILTGAGTVGLIGTFIADLGQAVSRSMVSVISRGTREPEYKSLAAPYLLSTAGIISGVSFFIAASKNKRRAAAMGPVTYIKLEQGSVLNPSSIGTQRFAAVALSLPL